MRYKVIKYEPLTIMLVGDGTATIFGERNSEYSDYLHWLAEDNVPDPPDPPPPPNDQPTLEDRVAAAETLINLILDEEDV